MKLKKLPLWLISGIAIFPLLTILGLILYVISLGKVSFLFWMIIPSIIFEELFETHFYSLSNNIILNTLFIILFWFSLAAFLGVILKEFKKGN